MKTLAATASIAFAAAPVAETVSLLDWMLDGSITTKPAASEAATVAAILTMVDLSEKAAAAAAPVVEIVGKHHSLLKGAEGFMCITGKVSAATAAKLKALGAKHVLRHGGSWSVSLDKAEEAFTLVQAEAQAGCPVCKLPKSKWGKRCPGKPVG